MKRLCQEASSTETEPLASLPCLYRGNTTPRHLCVCVCVCVCVCMCVCGGGGVSEWAQVLMCSRQFVEQHLGVRCYR